MRGRPSPTASFPDHSKLTLQFFSSAHNFILAAHMPALKQRLKDFFTVSVHKKIFNKMKLE